MKDICFINLIVFYLHKIYTIKIYKVDVIYSNVFFPAFNCYKRPKIPPFYVVSPIAPEMIAYRVK